MRLLKICSLRYARRLLDTGEFDNLISIGKPGGYEHVNQPWPHRSLSLEFWDSTPARGSGRPLFSGEQAIDLINFARTAAVDATFLIHCKAGRSRSSAAALIVMRALGHSEWTAIEYLLVGAPKSNPNGWMLKVADAVMGTHLFDTAWRSGIVKWANAREPAPT
jgi:predicted protein tyrosine phosphatase